MSDVQLKILSSGELEDKACVVIGTRPGIVMASPVIRELRRRKLPHFILHTGQHYSHNMDRQLLTELELGEPEHQLERPAGPALHGAQTGAMLAGCERVFLEERPKLVLVGGDANTNLAAALAARKLHIAVAHVEAGERSYDWRMPEEHNRVIIDHISEYLFTTNEKGRDNLIADSVRGRIVVTGNPIVDACRENLEIARRRSAIGAALGLDEGRYVVLTLHREENVDSRETLASLVVAMRAVARELQQPIVFAAHPRTLKRLGEFELLDEVRGIDGLKLTEAVGYRDVLSLVAHSALVMTDSGGVQQEACILRVPCVTLRDNTEWTETVASGANMLAGTDPEAIVAAVRRMLGTPRHWDTPFGDGRAASRIADVVAEAVREPAASGERARE